MIHRIEIGFQDGVRDAYGEKIRRRMAEHLGVAVSRAETIDVYTIEGDLTEEQATEVACLLFADPITQRFCVNRPMARDFDWLVEVGFLPGVTDNVGRTARETTETFLGHPLGDGGGVYTSRQFLFWGDLTRTRVEGIALGLLANPLIQRFEIRSLHQWQEGDVIQSRVPKVTSRSGAQVEEIDLEVSDADLMALSQNRVLVLELNEMKAIQTHLRDPKVRSARAQVGIGPRITDVELECLAQTWSEHCKHKIFNATIQYTEGFGPSRVIHSLFDTYVKGATQEVRRALGERDWCLSVFKDNAGVIRFNDDWSLVFKVETHNTPSALEPYGGALTGIVGVNRDPFGTGKGAQLIFNTDVFCFAPPTYDSPLPPRLLHPRRIFEGVREGVEHGGNKSGIPTVNGSIVFDDRYAGKPLVYCGTGGILPATILGEPAHQKAARPGDLMVMTGGRIGKDGIHGATFSSEELHEGSPVTAVQIGDPITQKKMTDFLLLARNEGLYHAITDNGAGGLSSSVGEMACDCGGCELHLEKAPLKYAGLTPWEILISEAQERMTLAVPPKKIDRFLELAQRMNVEATVLGTFTDTGRFHVLYEGRTVAFLEMEFLHEGVPPMLLEARWTPPQHPEPDLPCPEDLSNTLSALMGRLNICSKESVVRQYDHEVQAASVIKPLTGAGNDGPSDAAVLRPILDSIEGVVVSHGICPRYSDIDTYAMMAAAIDEALRNYLCVGGALERLGGLDNFCWPDPIQSEKTPDGRYKLAQLVRANQALYDITTAYGIPCISGKDSMKNDYKIGDTKISIPPTVLFSIIGRIPDVRQAVTMDAKRPGDAVYVLGLTRSELGGSEYLAHWGFIGQGVPSVEPDAFLRMYETLEGAIRLGLLASCHDCSDGGLGVALAETALAGGLGLSVDLANVPRENVHRDDWLLFSESQGRFVVTVRPDKESAFERHMARCRLGRVGRVMEEPLLEVRGLKGPRVVHIPIQDLKEAWKRPLANF
jgi:phosphoribosylformylglycinamidine synthase subunit PurSL